jgi:nucleoside 2-deoxyribosyltransferase
MNSFKVYLAGPISGLAYDDAQDWRKKFARLLPPRIECYSPLRAKSYLRDRGPLVGAYEENPLSTGTGITTRDRFDCTGADIVVFNLLGALRVSIGTMIEYGWADASRRPIVTIMEKGNIHEHPMIRGVSGYIVQSLEDAARITEAILLNTPSPLPEDRLR